MSRRLVRSPTFHDDRDWIDDMRLTITFPDIAELAARAEQRLAAERRHCLEAMSQKLLQCARADYLQKSAGGSGAGGVRWSPLTRGTLESRVRQQAEGRQIVAKRAELAAQIRQLASQSQRGSKAGASSRSKGQTGRRPSGVAQKIASLRQQRADLAARLRGLVDQASGTSGIGVLTGQQRDSGNGSFTGHDGRGENIRAITDVEVTVGYGRDYSAEFDALRPLLPAALPDSWRVVLEEIASEWGTTVVGEAFS